jgi:hypothetical protein
MFMPQSGLIENDQRRHIGQYSPKTGEFVPTAQGSRQAP